MRWRAAYSLRRVVVCSGSVQQHMAVYSGVRWHAVATCSGVQCAAACGSVQRCAVGGGWRAACGGRWGAGGGSNNVDGNAQVAAACSNVRLFYS